MLLTRAIGPGNFGLFTSALGITIYLSYLAGLSVNIYLIRRVSAPSKQVYHQAFTLLLVTGLAAMLAGAACLPLVRLWFKDFRLLPPLLAMLTTLPLTCLASPATAKLERELNYRAVAFIELSGQVINHAVALTLAYAGYGVWAPVAGYWLWQFYQLIATCRAAGIYPRPHWSWPLAVEMARYGAGFSASYWLWQLRTLVNPLLVGRFCGPEAVGIVALAIRFVEALSFAKNAAWRLSFAALAKIQHDRARLKRAVDEAMFLQTLALGPLLAVFAFTAPWVVPVLFGEQWSAVLVVYPFIALGYLWNALFNMHAAVLYVLRYNREVGLFHVTHVALLAGGAWLLLPTYGLLGYGLAEIVALGGYMVVHRFLAPILRPGYIKVVPWSAAFGAAIFSSTCGPPANLLLWLPLLGMLVLPQTRGGLIDTVKYILHGSKKNG